MSLGSGLLVLVAHKGSVQAVGLTACMPELMQYPGMSFVPHSVLEILSQAPCQLEYPNQMLQEWSLRRQTEKRQGWAPV